MYSLIISPKAQKELKMIRRLYRSGINIALQELKEDPFIGKPLERYLTGKYTYKVSVYRIIFRINTRDNTVYILTAGHRSTVYQ